jgi:hypothetical protein
LIELDFLMNVRVTASIEIKEVRPYSMFIHTEQPTKFGQFFHINALYEQ